MPSQYSPPGENSEDLFIERTNLDGLSLAGPFYGVLVTLALQCIYSLWKSRKHRKLTIPLIIYTISVLILGTLGYGTNAKFIEMAYIDNRNYPGGPYAFTLTFYSDWVNMMVFASYFAMSWLTDGLVLYRFTLFYNFRHWITPLPVLMYLGTVGLSIAVLVNIRNIGFWHPITVKLGITYLSFSVSLNIILTCLICGRILKVRNEINSTLGPHHSRNYISIMAMLVESASLYSIWGLLFIIPYARNSAVQNTFLPPLSHVQGVAALLIIFRVARGNAWTQNTVTFLMKDETSSKDHPPSNNFITFSVTIKGRRSSV